LRISQIILHEFKRFDSLTIDLGPDPKKIVALVGPNGCGKSSIFDAFGEVTYELKDSQTERETEDFYHKVPFQPGTENLGYETNRAFKILASDGRRRFDKRSFYVRSAYRYTAKLDVRQIQAQPDALDDVTRPMSSIAIDPRFSTTYEMLLGQTHQQVLESDLTGRQVMQGVLDRINEIIRQVLDVEISDLGNVQQGRGQLYFSKIDAKNLPYQNLSAGEKEVINIVLDLVVKSKDFNDTVYAIDEPELHLNTAIQRKLLLELDKLIPDHCQL